MLQLIGVLSPILADVIKSVVKDPNKASEIEKEMQLALLTNSNKLEEMKGKIVLAEANSANWLTSTWRPLLMMVAVTIIAVIIQSTNNVIANPHVNFSIKSVDFAAPNI